MLCAHPAGLLQSFAQLLAGAVMTDTKIVRAQAQRSTHFPRRLLREIQPANQFRIFRLKRGDERFDTGTSRPFFIRIRRGIYLLPDLLQGPLTHRAATIKINDRTAQYAIEPGHNIFVIPQLLGGHDCLEQTVLHRISSEFGVANASPREGGELVEFFEQLIFDPTHGRSQ